MREGWLGPDYVIIFPEDRTQELTTAYGLANGFADYVAIGLIGWDDFILKRVDGTFWRLPTVPQDTKYMSPISLDFEADLQLDDRFVGRIKWYVKPLVFGGQANIEENGAWIKLDDHCKAVAYWNAIYKQMKKDGE